MDETIKQRIQTDSYNMTIDYSIKLLERLTILLSKENPTSDIDKFVLMKTVSTDICFSCELLLKSKISTYNNGNGYDSWETHNLLDMFNKLSTSDQAFISNELGISVSNIINILNDKSTSDAFIKRYLYEENTGIPNYTFLCDLANALIKLNNRSTSFDLTNISLLGPNFNYQQFSFEEIIKKHSELIFRKAGIYDIADISDEIEEYIVQNMKSCDYALFSELRYKYFDKNQNPKKEHEFSQLHKRLDDACKFLISKGRYMDYYMSKQSTINFRWALESLMFYDKFEVGDSTKELYSDLNETFEKSRYCTINHYENYYKARDFAITIKSITDLLMMEGTKANRILKNKNTLLSKFGEGFMLNNAFTVDEIDIVDIDYLNRLSEEVDINLCPKALLLESNDTIREKIFYFISQCRGKKIPIGIDLVVEETSDGYDVNVDKYNASMTFEKYGLNPTEDNIQKYLELSQVISDSDLIIYIIKKNIDNKTAIERYNIMLKKCEKLVAKPSIIKNFIKHFGCEFIAEYDLNKFNKYFLLFNFFKSVDHNSSYNLTIDNLESFCNYPFERIVNLFYLTKKYNLQDLFYLHFDKIVNMNDENLNMTLLAINNNENLLSDYFYDKNLFNIDIEKFVEFIKKFDPVISNYSTVSIERYMLNEDETIKIYELIKSKNLLFLYYKYDNINIIDNLELIKELLNTDFFKNYNTVEHDSKDGESLAIFVHILFLNKSYKEVLFDLLKLDIVKDHPKVLYSFYNSYAVLDNIYKINIYNSWYTKIKSNNLSCNGSKINLDELKIKYLEDCLVDTIVNKENSQPPGVLSDRLEKLFANSQLIQCMTSEIFSKYEIEFMEDIIKDSSFKSKDFKGFNYFGNLFEVIDTNQISKDKIVNLLNKLYKYKNSKTIMNFVKKICSCKRTSGLSNITFEDSNGVQTFDDQLLDYLTLNLDTLNDETSVVDFISNIKIKIEIIDIDDILIEVEKKHEGQNPNSEIRMTGMQILESIKDKFVNGSHAVADTVIEKIASSYLARKIKIYQLNKDFREMCEGDKLNNGKRKQHNLF